MTRALPSLLFFLIAACSVPIERGAPVPVLTVMSEATARPFLCASFDPRSETCETVSKVSVQGNRIRYDSQLTVNYAGQPVGVRVRADSRVRGVEECFDGKSARVQVDAKDLPPGEADLIKQVLLETYAIYDGLCGTHYAAGDNGYFFIVTNEDGVELPVLSTTVQFFEDAKPLRFRVR